MNAGKDIFTLMREVKLPKELDVGESYGKLTWSVRGIYEGYAGWYDLNPATMYETPVASVFPDLVRMSGGPDAVVKVALERIDRNPVESLHLSDAALAACTHRARIPMTSDVDSLNVATAAAIAFYEITNGSRRR
jgi:alkyl sulfatase BDS1-like metallo-beta-lactamase superfamily hydrolase